jgi:hypothetical protein
MARSKNLQPIYNRRGTESIYSLVADDFQCDIGTLVEFVDDVETLPPDHRDESPSFVRRGARYRIKNIVGYAIDLVLESGDGPPEVRLLQSQMKTYVTLVQRAS